MGFRFRRSIRLFQGFRVNLSRSTSSVSIDRRGATFNVSERSARATVGIVGTGASYTPPTSRGGGARVLLLAFALGFLVVWLAL
jgi:hypothetical protein